MRKAIYIICCLLIGYFGIQNYFLKKKNTELRNEQALLAYKLTEQQQIVCQIKEQIKEVTEYKNSLTNKLKKSNKVIQTTKEKLKVTPIADKQQINKMMKKAFLCIGLATSSKVFVTDKRGCDF